jgi:hypothetical protein
MDAAVTVPKPKNISLVQAGTVGVGFYVRSAFPHSKENTR